MELKDLEARLSAAEVRSEVACRLADKALDMAMEATIKLEAMKQSTHRVELIPAESPELKSFKEELAAATAEEESEPVPKVRLSPFTVFGRSAEPSRQEVENASKVLEGALGAGEDEIDPFWEEGDVA